KGPVLDALTNIGVRTCRVTERRVGRSPGARLIGIEELDHERLVARHVRKVPPSVCGAVVEERSGGGLFLARPLAHSHSLIWHFINNDHRIRSARVCAEASPVSDRKGHVLWRRTECPPHTGCNTALETRTVGHKPLINRLEPLDSALRVDIDMYI